MNPSDQADAFRIKMLSAPTGDSDDDEEPEGLAAAIEAGDLFYDAEIEILTDTKNAERMRIMAGGTIKLLPRISVVPLPVDAFCSNAYSSAKRCGSAGTWSVDVNRSLN